MSTKTPTDPVANVASCSSKAGELLQTPEGRLLLGMILARSGYTPEKLDGYVKMLRSPAPFPAGKRDL